MYSANDSCPEESHDTEPAAETFWRVEGSLLNLSAVRPVAFFTWNAQSFLERWARRGGLGLTALIRPLLYATNRVLATRVLHMLLRGISQDRLDLLGEEYFQYVLQPRLNAQSVARLKAMLAEGRRIVLVSQALDHVMRPLARHLGVERLIANRLEFRDGHATGRLLEPVIRPRGGLARITNRGLDGSLPATRLASDLGLSGPKVLTGSILPAVRTFPRIERPMVVFDSGGPVRPLSVRRALTGKHILLIGTTGFIGKVWLVKILKDVPHVGKIYLLIRRQRSTTARRRFERIVEESPVFESFHEAHGSELARFLSQRIEVIEGDVSLPGLGLEAEMFERLAASVDLVVNSSGLTDFNPDLREALLLNVEATGNILEFIRSSDHAALLHLSTCFVVGERDGRIPEEVHANYTPAGTAGFDAEREWHTLKEMVDKIELDSESPEVTRQLRAQALTRKNGAALATDPGLEAHLRKYRSRWVRSRLIELGMERARLFGWPNTYTFTKSIAESMLAVRGAGLPVAIVRPSIVETSLQDPFCGWNEGVNTSAPISHLLGTYFRQLPSNERKCLDLIPVDVVCRGMALIAAALIERRHAHVYQLATSGANPCNMRRSIELTALAHRKHYRAQKDLEQRLLARFDSIPVSKQRYRNLSAPRQRAVVRAIQRISSPLHLSRPPFARAERGLDRVEKLIELYEPFILNNEHVFEADNIELLSLSLPTEERDVFGYDPLSIDWWEYWINIHIPALRKWSYPLIEGRPVEKPSRRTSVPPVQLNGGPQAGATARRAEEALGS